MDETSNCRGTVDGQRVGGGRPRSAQTDDNMVNVNDLIMNQEHKPRPHMS